MADATRPLPTLKEADTKAFWEATAQQEFRYQQCANCGTVVFYPRAHCTGCVDGDLTWKTSTGNGVVYSYSVVRQSYHPFFRGEAPYAVAWIDLEEGPRIMSNVVGLDDPGKDCKIGMAVKVRWEQHEGLSIPLFEPAG